MYLEMEKFPVIASSGFGFRSCTYPQPQFRGWLVSCSAGLVEEVEVGKGRVVRITGIQNKGRTATVLLRGSNKLVSWDLAGMLLSGQIPF
jgi:chaperonin GroEL (HSP60 family)